MNGENIAFSDQQPININHSNAAAVAGTQLDGVILKDNAPLLFSASDLDTSLSHDLTFIIADSGDSRLDSTAFIAGLGDVTPVDNGGVVEVPSSTVPEPGTIALFLMSLVGLRMSSKRKRKCLIL